MLDYIKKFNNLSKELRDKVSAPAVMSAIEKLEKKYNVNLATVVIKIMVKEIIVRDLAEYFISEFNLSKTEAEQLTSELQTKVLFNVADYLGIDLENRKQKTESRPTFAKATAGKRQKIIDTQEVRPMPSTKESDLLFSDEDEAEIKELAKQMDKKTETALFDNEIEKQLEKILAQVQINFGSEELVVRFKKILKIYLRGIRDRINTKQTLIKPIEAGGLGFDQESVDQVLKIVDLSADKEGGGGKDMDLPAQAGKIEKISVVTPLDKITTPQPEKEKAAALKDIGIRDIDYDLASLSGKKSIAPKKEIKEQDTGEVLKRLDTEHELAPPPPKLRTASPSASSEFQIDKNQDRQASPPLLKIEQDKQASPSLPLSQEVKPEEASMAPFKIKKESAIIEPEPQIGKPEAKIEKKQKIITKFTQEVKQIDARQQDVTTGKIKIEDVRFTPPQSLKKISKTGAGFKPKVMGPIDELKYMDLISFRRLDKEPVEIITKIKEKISLLEEEDYAKRFKGIKAWRTSPVNKLYLEMGQVSISENKPIDIIIEERKMAGKDFLNSKEFEAVTDLNKSLRF